MPDYLSVMFGKKYYGEGSYNGKSALVSIRMRGPGLVEYTRPFTGSLGGVQQGNNGQSLCNLLYPCFRGHGLVG